MSKENNISDKIKAVLVDYLSGQINSADYKILDKWIEADIENKKLFDQITDIWQASAMLNKNSSFNSGQAWEEISRQLNNQTSSPKIHRINSELLRIAAVFIFALLLGGAGFYFFTKKQLHIPVQTVEYVSPYGSRSFVNMPDGSKVWLNAGTKLKYQNNFGLTNRNIDLTGEAFFDVAKNKQLPFIVSASTIKIQAIGTKFNVKAYEEESTIETTLIEGKVELKSDDAKFVQPLLLNPNEKAVYTKSSKTIAKGVAQDSGKSEKIVEKPKLQLISSVDPEPIISWKEKRWVISNQKMGDLSVKLARRYDVIFVFENEALKNYAFGGTLEDETLDQVLEVIGYTAPIKFSIDKKTVYISTDKNKIDQYKNILMN